MTLGTAIGLARYDSRLLDQQEHEIESQAWTVLERAIPDPSLRYVD